MSYAPGALVHARGREWVVLPESAEDFLVVRPLGGDQDDVTGVFPEEAESASFPVPEPGDLGDQSSARLLRSALRLGFRSSAGPFRSFGQITVEPRAYQLVPLLMALREPVTRLLIADDVGVGKTVEAGLVATELLALGEARGLSVLCSPALAEQWQSELREKFGLEAEVVLPSTAHRLEKSLLGDESIFDRFPVTVVSTDFIKSDRRRHEFLRTCPDLVIVDEAHTCVAAAGLAGKGRTQRFELVSALAADKDRHLILVTATPHSGKEESFRNLVGLLDPALAEVNLDTESGRKLLARHFVQRRRRDIRRYLDQDTPFPTDRETKEVPYRLSPAYAELFEDVLEYTRSTVVSAAGGVEARVSWWSALALLRALASSPRAARRTLEIRSAATAVESVEAADAIGRSVVLDLADDEAVEAADATPGADTGVATSVLRGFRDRALALEGAADAKLKAITAQVKALLAEGDQPIVFCRFIDTAEYVAEHLGRSLGKNTTVAAVTGTLPPDERSARIDELASVEGAKVLVATDCLSEGVNLQEHFHAVIHYDLAWNPTRHEQREGRVDRFGQRRDVVRAVTMYGQDNKIDGIVLEVLLRKHEQIRKATGVSVPVPDSSDQVVEALVEGLLLRGHTGEQGTLDLELVAKREALESEWLSAAERESGAVTKYAQHTIHPGEVQQELDELRRAVGSTAEVDAFVRESLQGLRSTLTATPRGFAATLAGLPPALVDSLPPSGGERIEFVSDHPVPKGAAVLHRTDDAVEAVARFVLESALDPSLPDEYRVARRCAVVRTGEVVTATTVLVLRYRFQLELPSRERGVRRSVAEEVATVGYTSGTEGPEWLDDDEVAAVLGATASGNVMTSHAERMMERTLARLHEVRGRIDEYGEHRAQALMVSHRRVRQASRDVTRGLKVVGEHAADVLGVFVFLPEAGV